MSVHLLTPTAFNGLRIAMGLHMGEGKFVKDPTTGWLSYVGLAILVLEKICA